MAEHMAGLKVLKERLDGTVPTWLSRFVKEVDTRLELGGTVFELKHRGGGHTPGDWLVWLPQKMCCLAVMWSMWTACWACTP